MEEIEGRYFGRRKSFEKRCGNVRKFGYFGEKELFGVVRVAGVWKDASGDGNVKVRL